MSKNSQNRSETSKTLIGIGMVGIVGSPVGCVVSMYNGGFSFNWMAFLIGVVCLIVGLCIKPKKEIEQVEESCSKDEQIALEKTISEEPIPSKPGEKTSESDSLGSEQEVSKMQENKAGSKSQQKYNWGIITICIVGSFAIGGVAGYFLANTKFETEYREAENRLEEQYKRKIDTVEEEYYAYGYYAGEISARKEALQEMREAINEYWDAIDMNKAHGRSVRELLTRENMIFDMSISIDGFNLY